MGGECFGKIHMISPVGYANAKNRGWQIERYTFGNERKSGMKKLMMFVIAVTACAANPGAWTFRLTNGGRALTFGYVRGTEILLR